MIKNTFQVFKGITQRKEKELWNTGIKTWDDFLQKDKIKGISYESKYQLELQIKKCSLKLKENDDSFFLNLLPIKLHYRYYPMIKNELLFVDIESYGHKRRNEITIIGIGNGEDINLIRGDKTDSSQIKKIFQNNKGIVTYNGRSYDIPILKKRYNIDFSNKFIIDLKHLMNELGYKGGLKVIEEELKIERKLSHKIMNGDPINLWKAYKATEDSHFIELLAEYVEADVRSLPILLDYAYNKYYDEFIRNVKANKE
jgi:uncharacterized protein